MTDTPQPPEVTDQVIRGCFVYLEGICGEGGGLVVYDDSPRSMRTRRRWPSSTGGLTDE